MNVFLSPEDFLVTQRNKGNLIPLCIECNGIGIKYNNIFGDTMCICGQIRCDGCKGNRMLMEGITCWYCDGNGYLVALTTE